MYYRFLKNKEECIKKLFHININKIIPFNPSNGKREITKYQNTVSFDIWFVS
jgi:hypothetical protein